MDRVRSEIRRPSPPRLGDKSESTFAQKLLDIKRQRIKTKEGSVDSNVSVQVDNSNPVSVAKVPRLLLINGKPVLAACGNWALVQSVTSGKQYYFNMVTKINQWNKPDEWISTEVSPCQLDRPISIECPPTENMASFSGFKMKVASLKNVLIKDSSEFSNDKADSSTPLSKNKKKLIIHSLSESLVTTENNVSSESKQKAVNLVEQPINKEEERSHSLSKSSRSSSRSYSRSSSRSSSYSSSSYSSSYSSNSRSRSPRPRDISSTVVSSSTDAESLKAKIDNINRLKLLPPQIISASAGSNTWITEYNFPAMLRRCPFPRASDAIHELTKNRNFRRNLLPLPLPSLVSSDPSLSTLTSPEAIRIHLFINSLNTSCNRHRFLSEKLGITVYKISDDLWNIHAATFHIRLTEHVDLEARPHGYTAPSENGEEGIPVYMRTGKVANKCPFPEDVARCHAVMQAYRTQRCHLVYASKHYLIEKDNATWMNDLEDCRTFLRTNNF